MDEIFDRIKATKIKHKYLIASLIATEIFGIIVFIWLLRAPLYEKFLTVKPQAYLVNQMDEKKRYLLTQGDYLRGNVSNQGDKVVLLIWENGSPVLRTGIRPDEALNWSYQIPLSLNPGIKVLTIGELNTDNSIRSVKSYKIRVKSRDIINPGGQDSSEFPSINTQNAYQKILESVADPDTQEKPTMLINPETLSLPAED